MTTALLTIRFLDHNGRAVKTVRVPELRLQPGRVTGALVCDNDEEPFQFTLPARTTPVPVTVDYRPNLPRTAHITPQRDGRATISFRMKSPVPTTLGIRMGDREVFSCRVATW